jgi:hydroxymethylpyrimidine/phosphomethylpyrimidine kinase
MPYVYLLTPNLEEAEMLAGFEVRDVASMREAARKLAGMGPCAVLVKGGHLSGDQATDVLFHEGNLSEMRANRIQTNHTHGTGCTLSAAITALLARGKGLPAAVREAKSFLTEAIRTSPQLGHGSGPVNHQARLP